MHSTVLMSVLLALMLTLVSCGKPFEAIKPPATTIMFILNSNESKLGLPGDAEPLPLPMVDKLPDGVSMLPPSTLAIGIVEKANLALSPFDATARFEFKNPKGEDYYCSGQIIGPNRDVLLTAAHCVYGSDVRRWNAAFEIYTSYSLPGGTGTPTYAAQLDWICTAVFTGWAQGRRDKDYAFVKLRSPGANAIGLKLGLTYSSFSSMGYPINFYAGSELAVVEGTKGDVGNSIAAMRSNPFGGGSSGGAWFADGAAIGLNAFVYDQEPNVMYGPIFDGDTQRLYEFVGSDCQGSTNGILAGTAPRIESATMVVEAGTRPTPNIGPKVAMRQGSNCSCAGSMEVLLTNETPEDYIVTLQTTDFGGRDKQFIGSEQISYLSKADSKTLLGCSAGDSGGNACEISAEYRLLNSRRNIQVEEGPGLVSLATVGPAFCTQQCLNNPFGGYCYSTGTTTTEIVAGLKGFVDGASKPAAEGDVVSTIDDLVISFGGKPDQVEDPCNRSDFYRTEFGVTNEGIDCRVTSAPIGGGTDQLRLSLWNPTQAEATHLDPATRVPLFGDIYRAPHFEFFGPNDAILNQQYGGMVTSVTEVQGKLITSTVNGCIMAPISP